MLIDSKETGTVQPKGQIILMWASFIAAFICGILTIMVPGYFIGRALFSNPLQAIAFSPTASVALFIVVGLLAYPISMPSLHLYLLVLFLSLTFFMLFKKTRVTPNTNQYLTLSTYVLVGTILAVSIFLRNIDGPASYSVQTDTTFHLSCAKAMLDSGRYSILHASEYPDLMNAGEGIFYPAAWHIITAVASGLSKTSIVIAHNAINFIICSFVYPLSTWLFLSSIFKNDKNLICAGGITCSLFSYFPWAYLIVGQFDSNLLSNALLPGFLFAFYQLITNDHLSNEISIGISKSKLLPPAACAICLLSISFIALVGSQTNAVFSAGVICIPLIVHFSWKTAGRYTNRIELRFLASILTIGLIGILWLLVYSLPFIQPIVNVYREPTATPLEAFKNILLLKFGQSTNAQPILGLLVCIGLVAAFASTRYKWLSISYILIAALAFTCMTLNHPLRQLICGFWYSGTIRLNGVLAIVAVPLASIGLCKIAHVLIRPLLNSGRIKPVDLLISAFTICMTILIVAYPKTISFSKNNYRYLCDQIQVNYSLTSGVSISPEERRFVDKVKRIVGNKSVINIPSDGSIWLYASDDINVISRQFYSTPYKEYELFKTSLYEASENNDVLNAIQKTRARYVLILDETVNVGFFDQNEWKGILNITDDTPGFTCLLSDGDMRLYQIDF